MAGTIEIAYRGALGAFRLDAAFSAPGRGITALYGPSGCGKTSVLRCVAGLRRVDGICRVDGAVWQDASRFLPPHRRPVGYVFQEASLFAHLTVKRNLLYGAGGRMPAPEPDGVGFDEVVELLGLAKLMARAPHHLSGGERQRVAIGRALLSRPRLMLMDEPLSALDREMRAEVLPFLERLHARLSIPVLYVTHDLAEVERLADHLVLMREGRVLAAGPLGALQSDPALPLARAREAAVTLDAVVTGRDREYGLLALEVDGARFLVPGPEALAPGMTTRLRIGAGDVSVATAAPHATSILNVVPATIRQAKPLGSHEMLLVLGLGEAGAGAAVLARLTRKSWDLLGLAEGMPVHAQVKSAALAPR